MEAAPKEAMRLGKCCRPTGSSRRLSLAWATVVAASYPATIHLSGHWQERLLLVRALRLFAPASPSTMASPYATVWGPLLATIRRGSVAAGLEKEAGRGRLGSQGPPL